VDGERAAAAADLKHVETLDKKKKNESENVQKLDKKMKNEYIK
jgi:hypothetical protein